MLTKKICLIASIAVFAAGCAHTEKKAPAAAPAAKEAREAPKPSLETFEKTIEAVTTSVDAWAAAWSARDVPKYLAAYAPDFTPEHGSRDAWEKQRRERLGKKGQIKVTVSGLQVKSASTGRATATFVQSYESKSLSETSKKVLEFRETNGRWLITREYTRQQ
ncbi:MAG TPA: nuclear transport factor 2 family protein [Nevskiaceae bacterium]|nr:nuclear transport factor 2 family protein [Nevskiaceae bacterium]